jgi:hypothetical protein
MASERTELTRQLTALRGQRETAVDELVQRLIQIDALTARIDVVLERLASAKK